MNLCIGEKVETVVRTKRTGNYGSYLGGVAGCHLVEVDGIRFEVTENPSLEGLWFWQVYNTATLRTGWTVDPFGLPTAVRKTL